MKKHTPRGTSKKLLLIIFCTLILTVGSVVFAGSVSDLQDQVKSVFDWSLGIAGLLAGVSFAVGAIQYMLSRPEGKERMIGSALGLLLLFGSWLIMQTINPKLTQLSFTPLPPGVGVNYVKGNDEKAPAPGAEADTTKVVSEGYDRILYSCLPGDTSYMPKLLIWHYSKPDYKHWDGTSNPTDFERLSCGEATRIPLTTGWSLKWAFETTGVYFYTKSGCDGVSSFVQTTSGPTPDMEIKSVRLVMNKADEGSMGGIGVMLHDNPDSTQGGLCNADVLRLIDNYFGCRPISTSLEPGSVDIYHIPLDKSSAGTGINFYSEPTGWNETEKAGYFNFTPTTNPNVTDKKASALNFTYKKVDATNEYQKLYKTFKDKQGSIQILGNYLVGIFSKTGESALPWCQTFFSDVNNLGQEGYLPQDFKNGTDFNVKFYPAIKK